MGPEPSDTLAGLRTLWVTNEGAAEITANSIASLIKAAPDLADSIAIGCLDQGALDLFSGQRPEAQLIDFTVMRDWKSFIQIEAEGAYGDFGSARFRDVSFARYFGLLRLMEQGEGPVLYVDGDIAFIADPRPHLVRAATTPGAAVLLQCDREFDPETRFDGEGRAIQPVGTPAIFCTGFMCWLDPVRTRELSARIIAARDADVETSHDQHALNSFDQAGLQDLVVLPQLSFPNGSYLFARDGTLRFPEDVTQLRLADACLVHANWMVGMAAKIAALERVGLWQSLPAAPTRGAAPSVLSRWWAMIARTLRKLRRY